MAVPLQVAKWVWSHPSNRGRRLSGMARAVAFQARGRLLHRPTRARIGRTAVLLADLHSPGASKAVYANPPDWPEMLVWQQRLRPGDLFVDVGANVGTYSLWAADLGATVIALEPGALACQRLRRNIELNDLPISVIEAAASNQVGTTTIDADQDTGAHIGAGSRSVPTVTLDSVIGSRVVAGVKVDVEGAERLVLEGAHRALAEHRIGCLQLEWNSASLVHYGEQRGVVANLLTEAGYRIFRPTDGGALMPTIPLMGSDVFAVPDEPGPRDHGEG